MALNKEQLNLSILKAIQESKMAAGFKPISPATELVPTASERALALGIANAVDAYIRQATVTVPSGISVTTSGGTGSTTTPGTGTIS